MNVSRSCIGEVFDDLLTRSSAIRGVGATCLHACRREEQALGMHVGCVAVNVVLFLDEGVDRGGHF